MNEIIEQAKAIGMSELQINAVMGSLLGDACFGAVSRIGAPIRWNHSWKQMEYVQYKYQILQEFATKPPFIKPNPGYGDYWAILTLKSLGVFRSLHTMMYPKDAKQKSVLWGYLTAMTHPIALAWWFMDDGSRAKGHNRGTISTNGFTQEEVQLLVNWLKCWWHIPAWSNKVTHSTTGKTGWIIYLPADGYVRLCNLVAPYIPECMKYKLEVVHTTCPVCGSQMPLSNKMFCSPKCAEIHNKTAKHLYYELNKTHIRHMSREWKLAHREQINEAARQRYAQLTAEQKKAINEYARMWRLRKGDEYRAHRRAYRAAMKSDPEYQRKLKEERARYYSRVKQDPERYQKRLAQARERRHTEPYRTHDREYLRKHRMEKRAQNPEELARYLAHKAHLEELSNMSEEERQVYNSAKWHGYYQKKLENMTPEELAEYRAKQNELSAERWANKTPEQHARIKASQKKMRDSWTPEIRAKKAAQKKASYERKMAEIKADPEKYEAYLQKAKEDYQRRKQGKQPKKANPIPADTQMELNF